MLTKPASVFTQIASVVLFFWGIGQIGEDNGLVALIAIGIAVALFLWAGDSARKRIAMDQGRKDDG